MKSKDYFIMVGVCGLAFALLILLVLSVNVAPIGPEGTSIGLSNVNEAVHGLFGVNMTWYGITEWLGYAALLTALGFAAAGCLQLIRRRSLLKVDPDILALGGLYAAVVVLYVFFEKVIVNYRPIIMPGCQHPEASFPSSHTMLVCVVLGSAMMLMDKYVRNAALCRALRAACGVAIAVTVIGRLISGAHWLTDILGGLLAGGTLLALFAGTRELIRQRRKGN